MPASKPLLRSCGVGLLRAAAQPMMNVPPVPDISAVADDPAALVAWLRAMWANEGIAGPVGFASPALARQVRTLCASDAPSARDCRRAVLALTRYLLRSSGRATPFGWFSGVTAVSFGTVPASVWGQAHRPLIHAGAGWLAWLIRELESCTPLLDRLLVLTNNTAHLRGGRLVVPYQRHSDPARGPVEVSVAATRPLRAAMAAAAVQIPVADLVKKLTADFPTAGVDTVHSLVRELVTRRLLITELHAPSTSTDALAIVVSVLRATDAAGIPMIADLVDRVLTVATDLEEANARPSTHAGECVRLAERMRSATGDMDAKPLAVDLRLDARVVLPRQIEREVEKAAGVLTRLCARPFGTPAWKAWHHRFYERYGIGTLVPLLDAVADSGLGYPDGYPDTDEPERPLPGSHRDEMLLRLAQQAVLDGVTEIDLDDAAIAALELGPEQVGLPIHLQVGRRVPPHLEVGIRVHADDLAALARGRFELEVVSAARAAGVTAGRFINLLDPPAQAAFTSALAALPATDAGTVLAQLSFPPLDPDTAHVTRTPAVLPLVISIDEHRPPGPQTLTPPDLAVGCDGRRLYLAAPRLGVRIDAVSFHALNLHTHTPPLARFLVELCRANTAQVGVFDWGAARGLPFLPALRYGRTILSAARWRLDRTELPRHASRWVDWDEALSAWRQRRQLPDRLYLVEDDQRLPLDLRDRAHRVLLRSHLDRAPKAILTAAPDPRWLGWCGGRAHELTVPLAASEQTGWPRLPQPTPRRIVSRRTPQSPAVSPVLLATLYGPQRRQDTILAGYLPLLLDRLDGRGWYYMRYRDPAHHLRLRIALAHPDEFGTVAAIVADWADELRDLRLLRDLRFPTSVPETGRWGDGPAFDLAENVLRADSRAQLVQLQQSPRPGRRALIAAGSMAIACQFTGSVEAGIRWLIDHIPAAPPAKVNRTEHTEAVLLSNPDDDWAALRTAPAGTAIAAAWADRDQALTAYRAMFPSPHTDGVQFDDVLGSLLHAMFVRAAGVDFGEEAICLHLTRAAALAWRHQPKRATR